MNIVQSHLVVEHEVTMVVGKEETHMLAAGRMVGNEFIMEALGSNLIVLWVV